MNLALLISETFIAFVGQQNMRRPPMGGYHNKIKRRVIGDLLPIPYLFVTRDFTGNIWIYCNCHIIALRRAH